MQYTITYLNHLPVGAMFSFSRFGEVYTIMKIDNVGIYYRPVGLSTTHKLRHLTANHTKVILRRITT
jgi:hypothetical protein